MKRSIAVGILISGLAVGVLSAGQQPASQAPELPPVTFRAEVNYVEVDTTVTDAQGNVVSDLTADDFTVLEDGKPQTIASFSLVNLPIEKADRPLFASQAIEPDVQTNQGQEGRIYLFVLDDLHTDASRAPRVKEAMHRFIEQNFGINDLAAVAYTGGRAEDSQDFTNNPRLLLAAIDKFTGRKLRSATLDRIEGASVDPGTGQLEVPGDPAGMEREYRARSAMSAIRKLAEFMAGVRGRRKAMLLISEGVDYDVYNLVNSGSNPSGFNGPNPASSATSVLEDTRDAIAAATRGNVNIYAIDPRGLTPGNEELIGESSTLDDQGLGAQSLQSEQRLSRESLRVLASSTGGFAVVNQNDFNSAFDRIVRENSTYYLIGYYSTNEKRDGRFRKLQVRVKRPGMQARARSGYIAPRGRAASAPPAKKPGRVINAAITDALASPLPVTGIPIRVFAAAYKGTRPNASIALAVEMDLSMLDFVQANGTFNEKLEVVDAATDSNGKVFEGDTNTVNLAMKPATYERVKAHGFRLLSQMELPPGRYQLRIAAGNATGKAGSVVYDLAVPDFSKEPLVMSGVSLTSTAAPEVPTIRPKDPLAQVLPGPATATRDFAAGDTISLFAEVYENLRGAATHMVDLTTELRGEDGRVIRDTAEQRSSTELDAGTGGYGLTAKVPLTDLTPGLYVIHVQARSRAGAQPTVSRDIQIRVR